ncbi:MAG: helix-turn-helix domain-containing protein [Pseudomonadota bacterium]
MTRSAQIPAFGLYGEAQEFPDVVHSEPLLARLPINNWRIRAHRHVRMSQLFLIADGFARARVEEDDLEISGGRFLYIPEGTVHAFEFQPDTTGTVFSFPRGTVQSLGPDAGPILSLLAKPGTCVVSTELARVTDALAGIANRDIVFRSHLAVSLSHAVLSMVAGLKREQDGAVSAIPKRLQAFDQLISLHLADGWSAADYARALSLSTGHLSRLCRSMAGLGTSAYLERKRMGEACRLLAFTQLPASSIGHRVGYPDPSYFSKRFRRAIGLSPLSYRVQFTHKAP